VKSTNISTNYRVLSLLVCSAAIATIIVNPSFLVPSADSKTPSSSSSKTHHGKFSHGARISGTINTTGTSNVNKNNNGYINNKVVMINFDDSYKTQMLYAKPILDQYGFKATFFEVCGWVDKNSERQTWQDVAALRQDGMEIESHTMSHAHLDSVSNNTLYYELGFAKQCFANHGYQVSIFGYPNNLGSDNKTVVNVVAKYYSLARTGSSPLMFLQCDGFIKHPQTDCRTFLPNGTLSYANRYDIRSESFDHMNSNVIFNNAQLFQQFIQRVNSQLSYNKDGTINSFPIITYHNLTYSSQSYNLLPSTIMVPLFSEMMKYLYDNGFKVLTMNQLGYDTTNNIFYIKNVSSPPLHS
jgi:peptidoglycan/xylan/chitin deacetylase (PgdA/CDA1 family)